MMVNDSDISTEVAKIEDNTDKILQHRNDDYEYGREVLYAASERLLDILDSAVQLAKESEHPRAIEVAANTANSTADIAEKLMKLHAAVNKVNDINTNTTEKNVTNNNVNVKLNTKDLLDMLGRDS